MTQTQEDVRLDARPDVRSGLGFGTRGGTRIGLFGNGSVLPDATVRDGTVGDRIQLIADLSAIGVRCVYLAPEDRGGAGYGWLGGLDALVIETRDAVWPPGDGEPIGVPVYEQAKVLRRWSAGEYGKECKLWFWDFDLNARGVMGVAGLGGTYRGKAWREWTPWMLTRSDARMFGLEKRWSDCGERVRSESGVLVPYEPELGRLVRKRGARNISDPDGVVEESYQVARFNWVYPTWLETRGVSRWWREGGPAWALTGGTPTTRYTGSDYNRRRRFGEFYVRSSVERGWDVAVTGTWGNRRGGSEKGEWGEPGYRDRLEALTRAGGGPAVRFLSGKVATRQLGFSDMISALDEAAVGVQIVPDEYARLGYYTNRVAELAARGVPLLVDAEIGGHEWLEAWKVASAEQVWEWVRRLRETGSVVLADLVAEQRAAVRAGAGTATRLVEIVLGGSS